MRVFARTLVVGLAFWVGFPGNLFFDFSHPGAISFVAPAHAGDPCDSNTCGDPNFSKDVDANKAMGGNDSDCNGTCPKMTVTGNPINFATGNKFQDETDYKGSGPFPLVLTRYYNSQDDGAAHAFGFNWYDSYSRSLIQIGSTALIKRPNGPVFTFRLSGPIWAPDADVNARLTQTASGWTYVDSLDRTETYDVNGRLLSIANRAGLKQTLAYDALGRLTSVTDPFGRALRFFYGDPSFSRIVTKVTIPDGVAFTYGYDSKGRLVSVTNPEHHTRKYLYENAAGPKLLTGMIDEKNARFSTFAYDSKQRATGTSHAGGADSYKVDYTNIGTGVAIVTNPLGGLMIYGMQGLNGTALLNIRVRRTCLDNCDVSWTQYSYDANGNIVTFIDDAGNKTVYTYDTTRNLETSRTLGANDTTHERTISTTWHPKFRLPTQIFDGDRTWTFSYDAKGNLLGATLKSPTGASAWRFTYNGFSQVLTATDPRGHVTTYAYDGKGNLGSVTNALGQTVKFTAYDADGRPLSITDPNGLVTKLTYNFRGQVTSRTRGQRVTTYSYDPIGQLVKITKPDGSYLSAAYDAAHRLVGVSDTLGGSIAYTRDAAGNLLTESVYDSKKTLVRTHSWTYDKFNRLATDVGANAQTSNYYFNTNDLIQQFADPNGVYNIYSYNSQNRLSSFTIAGSSANLTYDGHGNIATFTDGRGLETLYEYGGLDNLKAIWSPDTDLTDTTADRAGNPTASLDGRGVLTTFLYDSLNRPTKVQYSGGETITYQYDAGPNGIGHLTSMADASGTTSWRYDAFGAVIEKQQKIGAVTLTTKWSYHPVTGQLGSLVYPSGALVSFGYDANGRVATITETPPGGKAETLISRVTYFPFGPVASWVAGNGATYARTYDKDGRITQITLPTKNTIAYAYDPGGRITNIQESGVSEKQIYYDGANHVDNYYTPSNGAQHSYGYDNNGNRTTESIYTGQSTNLAYTYDPSSNRLFSLAVTAGSPSQTSTETWTYDAVGNVVSDSAGRTFTYDDANRQNSAAVGALVTKFALDGLGQRVAKLDGAGNRALDSLIQFDLQGHVLGQYTGSGHLAQETVWLGDLPVATRMPSGTFYIAPDHPGAPHEITNAAQKRVWLWDHDPFGNGKPTAAAGFTYDLRFPGQLYDSDTGNFYNYFRDYDPRIGRYIESDPIGLAGGINTYAYAGGNPVSSTDPDGRFVPLALACAANPVCRGAVLGGLAFAGDVAYQLYKNRGNFGCVNWGEAAAWGLGGAGVSIAIGAGLSGGANSVFWSGYSQGARAIAEGLGTTLESTPIGGTLDFLQNTVGVNLPPVVWNTASAIFAGNATGTATAVILSQGATWINVELPILLNNGVPIVFH